MFYAFEQEEDCSSFPDVSNYLSGNLQGGACPSQHGFSDSSIGAMGAMKTDWTIGQVNWPQGQHERFALEFWIMTPEEALTGSDYVLLEIGSTDLDGKSTWDSQRDYSLRVGLSSFVIFSGSFVVERHFNFPPTKPNTLYHIVVSGDSPQGTYTRTEFPSGASNSATFDFIEAATGGTPVVPRFTTFDPSFIMRFGSTPGYALRHDDNLNAFPGTFLLFALYQDSLTLNQIQNNFQASISANSCPVLLDSIPFKAIEGETAVFDLREGTFDFDVNVLLKSDELNYVIETLPSQGRLYDNSITILDIPYTVSSHSLNYIPFRTITAEADTFDFSVADQDCGFYRSTATIAITQVNDAPVPHTSQTDSFHNSITFTATDPDPLVHELVGGQAHVIITSTPKYIVFHDCDTNQAISFFPHYTEPGSGLPYELCFEVNYLAPGLINTGELWGVEKVKFKVVDRHGAESTAVGVIDIDILNPIQVGCSVVDAVDADQGCPGELVFVEDSSKVQIYLAGGETFQIHTLPTHGVLSTHYLNSVHVGTPYPLDHALFYTPHADVFHAADAEADVMVFSVITKEGKQSAVTHVQLRVEANYDASILELPLDPVLVLPMQEYPIGNNISLTTVDGGDFTVEVRMELKFGLDTFLSVSPTPVEAVAMEFVQGRECLDTGCSTPIEFRGPMKHAQALIARMTYISTFAPMDEVFQIEFTDLVAQGKLVSLEMAIHAREKGDQVEVDAAMSVETIVSIAVIGCGSVLFLLLLRCCYVFCHVDSCKRCFCCGSSSKTSPEDQDNGYFSEEGDLEERKVKLQEMDRYHNRFGGRKVHINPLKKQTPFVQDQHRGKVQVAKHFSGVAEQTPVQATALTYFEGGTESDGYDDSTDRYSRKYTPPPPGLAPIKPRFSARPSPPVRPASLQVASSRRSTTPPLLKINSQSHQSIPRHILTHKPVQSRRSSRPPIPTRGSGRHAPTVPTRPSSAMPSLLKEIEASQMSIV